MTTQLDLLDLVPVCVLPGCTNPVDDPTQPCPDCERACAGYLLPAPEAAPLTVEDVARRDEATRDALRKQLAAKVSAVAATPERRRNQTCWLCEERRTCTCTPSGWECDTCREVR